MEHLSDDQLVGEIAGGHRIALDALYARYARRLYAFCRHAAHNPPPQDIEDLVQDIFLRVIKAAEVFDSKKASFRTWLFRIAHNRCIDFNRRSAREPFLSPFSNDTPDSGTESQPFKDTLLDRDIDTETRVTNKIIQEAISDCIAQLVEEEEHQAILLYYFAGKVYREIASIMGKSLSTVKNRIHTAHGKIKDCLHGKGLSSWEG